MGLKPHRAIQKTYEGRKVEVHNGKGLKAGGTKTLLEIGFFFSK